MDNDNFFVELPKIELHAHLNGSLSRSTLLQLKQYHADAGIQDKTNVFLDEFQIGAGDKKRLTDCFHLFGVAHSLTSTPEALALATKLTLQEFQDDGCIYLELRSTPRATAFMSKMQYLETIINTIQRATHLTMITRLIVSINRGGSVEEAEEIATLAVQCRRRHPALVVGVELSGDPTAGSFASLAPALDRARAAGLAVTLHCGEVWRPAEARAMLRWGPRRVGHATCLHRDPPAWDLLVQMNLPVEVCLTSNVKTKSTLDYESHHFKLLRDAGVPVIICTDDKGVFDTSLSREYAACARAFRLSRAAVARLALAATHHVFDDSVRAALHDQTTNFIEKHSL